MSISQDMTIPEIVGKYPQTQAIFKNYGLHVDGYEALKYENLFATSRVHQLDLQSLLQELNQAIQQS